MDEVEQEKLQKGVKNETERNKSKSSVSTGQHQKGSLREELAEIEETVFVLHPQLEEMGLEKEVTLIGARVYGSRTREGLYKENSDLMLFFLIQEILEKIHFCLFK